MAPNKVAPDKVAQDKILEHDSDGIQEYDNDLPKWWLWLFILTILWSPIYIGWFHFSGRATPREVLDQEIAKNGGKLGGSGDEHSVSVNWGAIASDDSLKKIGSSVYESKCAVCHGKAGEGLVGPNLTDSYWIHGGKPDQIRTVISKGVPEKGMLSWKAILKKEEITAAALYIMGLRGTKPPNPKPPQGNLEE